MSAGAGLGSFGEGLDGVVCPHAIPKAMYNSTNGGLASDRTDIRLRHLKPTVDLARFHSEGDSFE